MCSAVLRASCTWAFCNACGALQCLQLHYGASLNTQGVLRCSGHPVLGHLLMLSVTCNTQSLTVGHLATLRASCNARCPAVLRASCTGASCSAWDILQCSCLQECPFGIGRQGWARCWMETCAGTTLGLVCGAARPDVSQMLYSLPVWLLRIRLFMYLFVLDYKQNKKGFYNPAPRRLRVQDVICRLFTIVWPRLPAPCAVPGHALLCYGDFFPHDVFSRGMFSFLPPSGARGGNISRLL